MQYRSINLVHKLTKIDEQWVPKTIAEMNDYQFLLEKLEGDFVWHRHDDTDEVFMVIEGTLRIDFRDGAVNINTGEMYVVPKGVEHKPYAENEVSVMIIEPCDIAITGHEGKEDLDKHKTWV